MVMVHSSVADFSAVFAELNESGGLHFIQILNSSHKSVFYGVISI